MVGRAACHSLSDASKEVARNGIESTPKIALSFWCADNNRSPAGAWPVCTARLISLPLNSEPPPWTTISSLPPVATLTASAKALPFWVWKLLSE